MEYIIRRHPSVDGNKRTRVASAAYLLSTPGYDIEAEQQDPEEFAVSVAEQGHELAEIAPWFERHGREA